MAPRFSIYADQGYASCGHSGEDGTGAKHGSRETGLQQIAAGRPLPVEHFTDGVGVLYGFEHQRVVDSVEGNAACSGDGTSERLVAGEHHRNGFEALGRRAGLAQEIGFHRRKTDGFAQVIGARGLALWAGEAAGDLLLREVGTQVDVEGDRVAPARASRSMDDSA